MTKSCPPTESTPSSGAASTPAASGWSERCVVWGICLFLAAITFAVFGQTLRHGFINYDDDRYVYENATVMRGLTGAGIAQAFEHGSLANWDPLTTLSHMLDCQFYGLHAGGHHLTNVLLHTASVILLFLTLRAMTGALWRSAFVAALFAIHPLHVESVAWVSERKDTLSGLCFMLTLWAYVRYAQGPPKLSRYLMVVVFFVLGLMSKSMLITMPLMLLLVDYWPLQRNSKFKIQNSKSEVGTGDMSFGRLLMEKAPLLVLAAGACVMTVFAQGGAVKSWEDYPVDLRVANAVVSVAIYIGQMFWPTGLAIFYPYPSNGVPDLELGVAVVVLAGISAATWYWRRTRPYLLIGWLWYLIMLGPVMGLIQVGAQARADRYTYLPQIGLYVALTWLVAGLVEGTGWRQRRLVLGCLGGAAIAALSVAAFIQTAYWCDSETMWKHTIACTRDNVIAHNNLGSIYYKTGRTDDAVVEFQQAVESQPDYAQARGNLGSALLAKRRYDEAIAEYQKAVELQPGDASYSGNLALALLGQGRLEEAIPWFERSVTIQPDNYDVQNNFGVALFHAGRTDEAIAHLEKALELKPDSRTVRNSLAGIAWVLAANPDDSVRNGAKAVALAEEADRAAGGKDPVLAGVLAGAYAEAGRFQEAVATAQHGLQLAQEQSNAQLAAGLQQQLGEYQAGRPFRDASLKNGPGQDGR